MSIKVILISHVPLPYHKIGSWTTLYDNYINSAGAKIDSIICPKPKQLYDQISYTFYAQEETFLSKIQRKLKWRYKNYTIIRALEQVIDSSDKYIIKIIDNYGLATKVVSFLKKNNLRQNCYIQYYYHGFLSFKNESIYSSIDELVLLTADSYQQIKTNTNSFPCRVSVLHNAIDTSNFHIVPKLEQQLLKQEFGVNDKKTFVWCSQDRPKKGLHLILDVWKKLTEKHKNIELWIIGTEIRQNSEGIKYIGRVPNHELPKYYQAADVYLFSTLCQEGFGLSLIEAKHSGCYCIASALGGVPEVLAYGKYGRLIENPNFVSEWVLAIEAYLEGNYKNIPFPKDLYAKEVWNKNMNNLIENAKESIK